MDKIINKLKSNSLFFKLTLIMLISSISISIITAFTIMNISKKVFINNFSITNSKILNQIGANSADLNDKLISLMNTVNNSWAFRRYLSEYNTSIIDQSNIIYNLKQHLKVDDANLDSKDIDFLLIGSNNSTYIRSTALLTTPVNDIKENQITKNSLKNPDKLLYQYSNSGFNSLTENRNVIIATKVLQDQGQRKQFGMLYISINENTFKNLYSNFTNQEQ